MKCKKKKKKWNKRLAIVFTMSGQDRVRIELSPLTPSLLALDTELGTACIPGQGQHPTPLLHPQPLDAFVKLLRQVSECCELNVECSWDSGCAPSSPVRCNNDFKAPATHSRLLFSTLTHYFFSDHR